MIGLAGGGTAGLLVGFVAGWALSGPILGSMLSIAGAFVGAFVGWGAALWWPADTGQDPDYDDTPPLPPAG